MTNEEKTALDARKKKLEEAEAIALDVSRKRKQLKEYERFIAPFFDLWDRSLEALPHARSFIPESDRVVFDKLVRDFKQAGTDLNVFLRALRLRMLKGK
jgi:hypothetical protein